MTDVLGAAYVTIQPDTSKFEASLKRQLGPALNNVSKQLGGTVGTQLSNSLKSVNAESSKVSRSLREVFTAAAGFGTGVGAAVVAVQGLRAAFDALVGAGVRATASLEQVEIGFAGLLKGEAAAEEAIGRLRDFARTTPFEFSGLVASAQQFVGLGKTVDETISILTDLGNALALVGRIDPAAIASVTRAFGQIQASGRLLAQDLNQVTQAIPLISRPAVFAELAASLGTTTEEVQKLQETGQITADQGLAAILAVAREIPGATDAMARSMNSVSGAFSNFRDAVDQGLGQGFTAVRESLRDALIGLTPIAQEQLGRLGAAVAEAAAEVLPQLVEQFSTLAPTLVDLTAAVLSLAPALTGVSSLLVALEPALSAIATIIRAIPAPVLQMAGAFAAVSLATRALGGPLGSALTALKGLEVPTRLAFLRMGDLSTAVSGLGGRLAGLITPGTIAAVAIGAVAAEAAQAQEKASKFLDVVQVKTQSLTGLTKLEAEAELLRKKLEELEKQAPRLFGASFLPKAPDPLGVSEVAKQTGILNDQLEINAEKQRQFRLEAERTDGVVRVWGRNVDLATVGFKRLADAVDVGSLSFGDLRDRIDAAFEPLDESLGAALRAADATDRLAAAEDRLGEANQRVADILAGRDEQTQRLTQLNETYQDSLESVTDTLDSLTDAQTELGEANEELAEALVTEGVRAWRQYEDAQRAAHEAALDLADAEDRLDDLLKKRAEGTDPNLAKRLADLQARRSRAFIPQVIEALDKEIEKVNDQLLDEEELDDLNRQIAHSENDVAEARNGVADATQDVIDAQEVFTRGTEELRTAQERQAQAQDTVNQRQEDYNDALADSVSKLGELQSAQANAKSKAELLRDAERDVRDATREVVTAAEEMERRVAETSAEAAKALDENLGATLDRLVAKFPKLKITLEDLIPGGLDAIKATVNLSLELDEQQAIKEAAAFAEILLENFPISVRRGLGVVANQMGGPIAAGQLSLVGEEGPELFLPATAGRILSKSDSIDAIVEALRAAVADISEARTPTQGVAPIAVSVTAPATDARSIVDEAVRALRATQYLHGTA